MLSATRLSLVLVLAVAVGIWLRTSAHVMASPVDGAAVKPAPAGDSATAVKERIAAAVNQARSQAGQPELERHYQSEADTAACSIARANGLNTASILAMAQNQTVLTFTSLRPEFLPEVAIRSITRPGIEGFSVGACFSQTDMYPTGAYWVVLSLY
jgi:hypothetical protein